MPAWVDGAFVTDHAGPPAPGTTDEPTGRYAAEHDHDWSVRRTSHRRTCRSAEADQLGRKDELQLIHDSLPRQRTERLGIHEPSITEAYLASACSRLTTSKSAATDSAVA